MMLSVDEIWSRQDVESGDSGEFRRQIQGINAAWKTKYLRESVRCPYSEWV